jgi:hypothetical protein
VAAHNKDERLYRITPGIAALGPQNKQYQQQTCKPGHSEWEEGHDFQLLHYTM